MTLKSWQSWQHFLVRKFLGWQSYREFKSVYKALDPVSTRRCFSIHFIFHSTALSICYERVPRYSSWLSNWPVAIESLIGGRIDSRQISQRENEFVRRCLSSREDGSKITSWGKKQVRKQSYRSGIRYVFLALIDKKQPFTPFFGEFFTTDRLLFRIVYFFFHLEASSISSRETPKEY